MVASAAAALGGAPARETTSDGWTQATNGYERFVAPYQYRRGNAFISDLRLADPAKALKLCRRYRTDHCENDAMAFGWEVFLYPSTRSLPQAAEAQAIYEHRFKGAAGPVARMQRALEVRLGELIELQAGATPEVLHTIVTRSGDGLAMTVAEWYAYNNRENAALVQWLNDGGARLCEKDGDTAAERFSCINFYLMNDRSIPRHDETLDMLERNGFRPRTATELHAAARFAGTLRGGDERYHDRYDALLAPADRARIERIKAGVAERTAAAKTAAARASGDAPATEIENLAAVRLLREPGTSVCRQLVHQGTTYRFAARVEGASRTRLQLRAGAIRTAGQQLTNLPYRDARVSPGVVFWDDAGLWSGC